MIISSTDLQSKQNTYLTAEQVAELLGCSKRWTRELADAYGAISIQSNVGQGGISHRFPLHNLPPEAQRKYMEMQTKRVKTAYETAPQWIRDQAEQRLWLLEEWEDYCSRHSKLKKPEIFKLFAADIRSCRPELKFSLASLYRWEKAYREKGMDGLLGKTPTQPQRKIHPEAWQRFCELYLRPQRLSISYCYDQRDCRPACAHGYPGRHPPPAASWRQKCLRQCNAIYTPRPGQHLIRPDLCR